MTNLFSVLLEPKIDFSPSCSLQQVYRVTVEPIIPIIFQRTKATCFAYGQTGTHSFRLFFLNVMCAIYVIFCFCMLEALLMLEGNIFESQSLHASWMVYSHLFLSVSSKYSFFVNIKVVVFESL